MITTPLTRVFVAENDDKIVGLAITYLIQKGSQWNKAQAYHVGALAALIVDPDHRNLGIGSALHSQALEYLTAKVKESFKLASPEPEKSQIQLGSTFPRIFPGVPAGPGFDEARSWFEKRGWKFGDKQSIDLYQSFPSAQDVDLEGAMKKAKNGGFTFGEPRDEDVEKLYQLQRDNFDSYTVSRVLHVIPATRVDQIGLAGYVPGTGKSRSERGYPRRME